MQCVVEIHWRIMILLIMRASLAITIRKSLIAAISYG
jgi:hypothetical protein